MQDAARAENVPRGVEIDASGHGCDPKDAAQLDRNLARPARASGAGGDARFPRPHRFHHTREIDGGGARVAARPGDWATEHAAAGRIPQCDGEPRRVAHQLSERVRRHGYRRWGPTRMRLPRALRPAERVAAHDTADAARGIAGDHTTVDAREHREAHAVSRVDQTAAQHVRAGIVDHASEPAAVPHLIGRAAEARAGLGKGVRSCVAAGVAAGRADPLGPVPHSDDAHRFDRTGAWACRVAAPGECLQQNAHDDAAPADAQIAHASHTASLGSLVLH